MKRSNVICDVEVVYKKTALPTEFVNRSQIAAAISRAAIPEGQINRREYFGVLLLNRGLKVLNRSILSIGGLNSTIVDPKHLMQCTILANAAAIILFHNHPSGEVIPSESDLHLTQRIKELCKLLEISLFDHIILSGYAESAPNYFSFADEGLL